jgi:hypothetical protein
MGSLSQIWALLIAFVGLTFASCTTQAVVQDSQAEDQTQVAPSPREEGTLGPRAVPIQEDNQPSSEPVEPGVEPDITAILSPTPAVNLEPTKEEPNTRANANILFVKARQESEDSWHFTVTVEHPDTGWEDYADGWDVVLPDGSVVRPDPDSPFTRLLLHPHETEQPFTRSQGGIVIAPGITFVTVRAHDLVDGFGGREVIVDLMADSGTDYEVQRLFD